MDLSYESQRLANIRKNQELLSSLGLLSSASKGQKRKRITARRPKPKSSNRTRLAPTRRSARLRPGTTTELKSLENVLTKAATEKSSNEAEKTIVYRYDDSNVLRYAVDGPGYKAVNGEVWSGKLTTLGEDVEDCDLKRMYSMDWKKGVMLAGGHQGRVALFGARKGERKSLMSFKACRGWISTVQFVQMAERDLLFLTASNDGSVMLWDASAEHDGSPKQVSIAAETHSGGIFSLHAKGMDFVTGSKDRSVVAWRLGSTGELQSVRVFNDQHAGVVKSVRLCPGSNDLIASVGNDSALCIRDLRDGQTNGLRIAELHNGCCVNSVRWHPTRQNLIMTTGFDTGIELHDSRKLSNPIKVLDSHMPDSLCKVKSIYHPCFIRSGKNIITSGEKTEELTVYCTETGKVVSRGDVSFQATALAVDDDTTLYPKVAAAHGKQISFYRLI